MHPKVFSLLTLLFIALPLQKLFSQTFPDTLLVKKGKAHALRHHELATEGSHHLYNGSEYIPYQPLDEEHPYFMTEEWTPCTLKYDDEWFYQVPLLFDIEKGKLIASYYYKGIKMELIHNRIDEFTLSGHRFVNIKSTTDSTTIKKGFYESLYDGKTQVLARRNKKLNEKIEGTVEFRQFLESNSYFISAGGKFHKISGKRDVLRVLEGQKKDLKIFIRKNGLFNNNLELSIAQTARYFDSLNQ